MKAQGQRQRTGSPTAFYQEIRHQLEGGGFGTAAMHAALGAATEGVGGGIASWLSIFNASERARQTIATMAREKKVDRLAELFKNETTAKEWAALARAPSNSQRARDTFSRLARIVTVAGTGNQASQPPPE
jgi:hypothetical protein